MSTIWRTFPSANRTAFSSTYDATVVISDSSAYIPAVRTTNDATFDLAICPTFAATFNSAIRTTE
jgi:hypothetical protein